MHFVDRAGLRARGQHERGLELLACSCVEQAQAARELRIARARARGVDQHEAAVAQSSSSSGSSAMS